MLRRLLLVLLPREEVVVLVREAVLLGLRLGMGEGLFGRGIMSDVYKLRISRYILG